MYNFRLTLWIFMTFVVLFMVVYTIRINGPQWKIIALSVALLIGIVVCILLYRINKNKN